MKTAVDILLYIWQLPQNIVGLALIPLYRKTRLCVMNYKGRKVYVYDKFPGGVSLGRYIHVDYWREHPDKEHSRMKLSENIRHEYGHCIQSKRWGPLYLFVPGMVSLIHNIFCNCEKHKHKSYYSIWPENEADRLGGVVR